MGWTVADIGHRLNWADLWVIVSQAPPDSALGRSMDPDWRFDTGVQMLRQIEFNTRTRVWQESQDGSRGVNQPEPIALFESERPKPIYDAMSIAEAKHWLGWE